MSAPPPTIRDVAERAGVSIATVSRLLTGTASVTPATREKVEEAISSLAFTPDPAARALGRRRAQPSGSRSQSAG